MAAVSTPTKEDMVSLVYVSSGRTQNEEEIRDILRVSRKNNAPRNITGLLAYREGNFLQVLEGPVKEVNEVMEAIERDPRHSGLLVLAKRPLKERLFPEWSMAYKDFKDLSPEEEAAYSPLLDGSLLDERHRAQPNLCYSLLLTFKRSMR